MQPTATDIDQVAAAVERARDGRPDERVVVGVSGFGGAGKSTLAHAVAAVVDGSVVLRGDDFLDPERSHRRSDNWDGVERQRIRSEVIDPFRSDADVVYRPFDWGARTLGVPTRLPEATVLIVEGIGLFHPEFVDVFDLTVWVDVPLEDATRRGIDRDRREGHAHDELWTDVWVPNDRDFADAFDPRSNANLLYVPDDLR